MYINFSQPNESQVLYSQIYIIKKDSLALQLCSYVLLYCYTYLKS